MLEKFAERFAGILIKENAINEEEKEIYVYGIMLWITTIIGMLSIMVISTVFFKWYWGLLFLIFYTPLRVCAGGYHCNTYFWCFIVTNLVFFLNMALVLGLVELPTIESKVLSCCILGITYLYVFLNAPVTSTENQLSARRVNKNRIRSIVVATVLIMVAILFMVHSAGNLFAKECVSIITSTKLTVMVLMILQKFKERRKEKNV